MARLIKHCSQSPEKITVKDEDIWLCRCGLSNKKPYCDASHQQTLNEDTDKLYIYKDGQQIALSDSETTSTSDLPCAYN